MHVARSLRLRLAVLYSAVLVALAGLLMLGVYLALAHSLDSGAVPDRTTVVGGAQARVVTAQELERQVNQHALERLQDYSLAAIGILFVTSLLVGWVVAGRALAPVDRVTRTARDIGATSLERRIRLAGTDDKSCAGSPTPSTTCSSDWTTRSAASAASPPTRHTSCATRSRSCRPTPTCCCPSPTIRPRCACAQAASAPPASGWPGSATTCWRWRGSTSSVRAASRPRSTGCSRTSPASWRSRPRRRASCSRCTATVRPRTVDRIAVRRAVANLVENALRHAPAGSAVRLASGEQGRWAWIAVEDDGPGIDAAHRARVFDRFYRIDRARSRADGGSGLGLAIVREVARAHGGDARLHSEPGRGACFVLWLPARPGPDGAPEAAPRALRELVPAVR